MLLLFQNNQFCIINGEVEQIDASALYENFSTCVWEHIFMCVHTLTGKLLRRTYMVVSLAVSPENVGSLASDLICLMKASANISCISFWMVLDIQLSLCSSHSCPPSKSSGYIRLSSAPSLASIKLHPLAMPPQLKSLMSKIVFSILKQLQTTVLANCCVSLSLFSLSMLLISSCYHNSFLNWNE